jgi:adenine-specific DNA-methyltransferase
MAKKSKPSKRELESYVHEDKTRANNPPVGLVTPETDKDAGKKTYAFDPHLDPQLQWAGKAEGTAFEVPTVSLHVHERIDPLTIIEAVRRQNGSDPQLSLFALPQENLPLREAIEFYKHKHNWSNRLIAGDSVLVMNSLLEKEGLGGQVQMVFIDPPYGIDYASNFQPFATSRTVKDRDSDLTQEPETIRAFRDTWHLGIHSYLSHLHQRLLLSRELLAASGSVFVQIGQENVHLVRSMLDEVFGRQNLVAQIYFRKKMMPLSKKPGAESMGDYLLWYAKSKPDAEKKLRKLFVRQITEGDSSWRFVEEPDGSRREMTDEEIFNHQNLPKGSRVYSTISMKPREYRENQDFNFEYEGQVFPPPGGDVDRTPDGKNCWSTTLNGMRKLASLRRLQKDGRTLRYVLFHDDYPVMRLTAHWPDTAPATQMRYVVETSPLVVQRCMLMSTDPGDLVLDPTCGSGTTAFVAERWGRRWIACDSSRVSVALARQRLMTSAFEYYELAHDREGVSSGFRYKTVPHVTLGSLANNEPRQEETLFDEPYRDPRKARVAGPFTVEAVPAPSVTSIDEVDHRHVASADESITRSGETLRQGEWRDELLKTGIRGKGGQRIDFSRVEALPGTRWLHADAETRSSLAERVVVSFGPDHAPLEQRQVELALGEAETLRPKPKMIVFAAFQFDPEAAKDIDETNWPGVMLLKAQMNADLLTDDLKKKRASNESFWLIGQPDVALERTATKSGTAAFRVTVNGFDYYNTRTGEIDSGASDRIAMWMLDPDYDGRSLFPHQVFFIADIMQDGLERFARTLQAEVNPELIESYLGMVSLPFHAGRHKRAAVKIIDDRGIESLRIIGLE